MRVDVPAPSVLSTPIHNFLTRTDIDRPLQTYANIVAILPKRLKTRFCILRRRIYTWRPQICTFAQGYCRSRTIRAFENWRTLCRHDSLVEMACIHGVLRWPLVFDSEARCSLWFNRTNAQTARGLRRLREVVRYAADDEQFQLVPCWRMLLAFRSHLLTFGVYASRMAVRPRRIAKATIRCWMTAATTRP